MYKSFTEMPVWQKAHDLSIEIFKISNSLPRSEDYGLTSQIRRSSNSISGNIAEAFGRNTSKDKQHFYIIARGSAYEIQSHLLYGGKAGYFDKLSTEKIITAYNDLILELNKIIKSPSALPQP
jgi:four helix bundle protein